MPPSDLSGYGIGIQTKVIGHLKWFIYHASKFARWNLLHAVNLKCGSLADSL